MTPRIPQALLQRQPKSAPGLGVEHRLVVRLLNLRGLVEPARMASKSKKKPPTASCDGHESHQQSEGTSTLQNAEIHSLWSARSASLRSPQSLSGPVSSKLPRATSSATTWEQDMFHGCALRRRAAAGRLWPLFESWASAGRWSWRAWQQRARKARMLL